MRIWSLHPRYLDTRGLTAAWREALLARAVLRGLTRGYRHHPQLERFRAHAMPRSAINAYLAAIHSEATRRGYSFDRSRFGAVRPAASIAVTSGQVQHEWAHLLEKLRIRSSKDYERWRKVRSPETHPAFVIVPGGIEPWERITE
jgi:hypothetical protein